MLNTLLTAPATTFIYPGVKGAAGRVAGLAAILTLLSAAAALLELALGFAGLIPAALLAGAVSQLCLQLLIICLGLLTPWCVNVLVAGRGNEVSRWLAWLCPVLSLLILACTAYSSLTFKLLMIRQATLPLLLLVLQASIALTNLPRMAAATLEQRAAIVASPLLLLVACLSDFPGLLPICAAAKLLTAAALTPLLRQLCHFAPRVISLPELDATHPPTGQPGA